MTYTARPSNLNTGENIHSPSNKAITSSRYSQLTHLKPRHRIIYAHNDEPYDPPTFLNTTVYQYLNRPCLQTPTAFKMHLRFGCKSLAVLKHTQRHVEGMQIQQGTWKQLETQLPCSACIAGKMRKTRKNPTKEFTEVNNLALSWTPPRVLAKRVHPCSHISNAMAYLNKLFTTMHKSFFTVNLPKYVQTKVSPNFAAHLIIPIKIPPNTTWRLLPPPCAPFCSYPAWTLIHFGSTRYYKHSTFKEELLYLADVHQMKRLSVGNLVSSTYGYSDAKR